MESQPSAAVPCVDRPPAALRPRSSVARFMIICAIFIGSQLLILLMSWGAVEVINVSRSYVTVEALYSKAQKTAVLDLHRYTERADPADFAAFSAAVAIAAGDHAARAALEETPPRLDAAAAGFRSGGSNPSDINGLIEAFLWLRRWGLFSAAIDDWRASDRLVVELQEIGDRLREAGRDGSPASTARASLLAEADAVDKQLTALENSFALHMGDAARMARNLALLSLGVGSLFLWTIGIRLVWKVYKKGREAERQLISSEERLRDYAEIASDWFWEMDAGLRFTYVSERFGEIAGAPALTLLSRSPVDADGADNVWSGPLDDLTARRAFRHVRYRAMTDGGRRKVWAISGKPIFDELGEFRGYRGTGADVTVEVEALEALREAKERAEAASRAKSDFLANMSHELRTPLNAIIGFSEVIKAQIFGSIENQRYVGYAADVHGAGLHLLSLINDILDLSKIEAGKGELDESTVDIAAVVNWAVRLTRERMQNHGLVCTVLGAEAPILMRADERRVKQIVVNLLSNAIKFTPSGGRITIAATAEPGHDLSVSIADTGIGIAEEDIPKALAPFDQINGGMNRKFEGTGLGLSLTKSLVELHQGSLKIESAVGIGTTVTFTLPARRLVIEERERPGTAAA